MRVDTPKNEERIQMDDWSRAVSVLPGLAEEALDNWRPTLATAFLLQPTVPYVPFMVTGRRTDLDDKSG